MRIKRTAAKNLKVGSIVQGNVSDIRHLDKTWYEVTSLVHTGKDVQLDTVRVVFTGGVANKRETVVKYSFHPRMVLAELVHL